MCQVDSKTGHFTLTILFSHCWLVEGLPYHYMGITLHSMKRIIYWARFDTIPCSVSKKEIISRRVVQIFSLHGKPSIMKILPHPPLFFLLNFPSDLLNNSSKEWSGFSCCLLGFKGLLCTKQERKPVEIKDTAKQCNLTSVNIGFYPKYDPGVLFLQIKT